MAASIRCIASFLLLAGWLGSVETASAHPGSGIVVDGQGRVFFVHAEVGVWKIDASGQLGRAEGPSYHFMILDPGARFARQHWPRFPDGVIEVVGADPALLLASSFPVTIGRDGALYYPEAAKDGRVHILRVEPHGEAKDFATLPVAMEIGYDGLPVQAQWIHGLATAPDGTLYYAEKQAIRRIHSDGTVSEVAADILVPDCVFPAVMPDGRGAPTLRGIAVAADGAIYAAASGCCALLKITPAGEVAVVLRATDSWSPSGVAVAGNDVYVLENLYVESKHAKDWLPRVRKIAANGMVTTLATVSNDSR